MNRPAGVVRRLPATDAPRVVDVIADAFRDYPVMRHVLGPAGDYPGRLHHLVRFFVTARILRDEPLFGIGDGADLDAAAVVSYPHLDTRPPALAQAREIVWTALGPDARARYEACGRMWATLAVTDPHVHVNMIGVRAAHRGRGLAKRLLQHVHELSANTPESAGVTLTTEDPANVPFYEHLGYRVIGHERIAAELETWSLFRAERAASARNGGTGRPGA